MRRSDSGVLDGPVVVFGGPYSNLQATSAVLAVADRLGAHAICTGDVVAYCARPAETVDLIRAANCTVVAGNCEIQLAQGAQDCGCGFDEGSACDLLSVGWYGYTDARISVDARKWMAGLPDTVTFTHHGARYAVIHGGVSDVARFLWSTSPRADFEAEWDALEAHIGPVDHIIAGHSGIPFQKTLARGSWINAGVVGMPPHDGRSATRYGVLSQGKMSIETMIYDVAGAVRDMRFADLTQGYHTALMQGYWPSEDVLPPDLRLSLASG